MIDRSRILILVPAFNEEKSVGEVLRKLRILEYPILLISDGSSDDTAQIGRAEGIPVLDLPINLGVGGALRAGFKYANRTGFEAVVQIDADGQHPVDEIEGLIAALEDSNSHMVIGSRFIDDAGQMKVAIGRRIVMKVLSRTASAATGTVVTDSTSGFRIIRQPLLREFSQQFANNYLGDTYEAVVAAGRAGYVVTEIPAGILPRDTGQSSASTGAAIRFTLKSLSVWLLGIHKRINRLK